MDNTTQAATDSAETGFYDNFLQERSIKWILMSGGAILLGSSLMLVSSQWSGYSALFKEAIILAYTYGIFLVGRYGYDRLGLRRTGTMLLALSVLLAPAACAALPWVWETESWNVAYATLLIACGGMTLRIGASSFRHFLREPQPTLTAAYVVLGLAGAVVPLAPMFDSPWAALALWTVFAVGATKGNRRVFWLLEEHRRPRILGFFPMGLLGAQFLGLFAANFAAKTSLAWMGLGCVLTALPIAAAADATAAVFQRRTGNLLRPLPVFVLLPLVVSLMLAAVGIIMAATEIPGGKPYALVPAAILAAGLTAATARRTERREYVYLSVLLTVVAYRYVPAYFADVARYFVQSTATAIREPQLPWAYYGFTFVPLLTAYSSLSVWALRRDNELFAVPLRRCAIGLALIFLGLAVTHEKALFPAAFTLMFVFAGQTILFRDRLPAVAAAIALVLAAFGLPAFYNGVLVGPAPGAASWPQSAWFVCETIVAALLLTLGGAVDRRLRRLPLPGWEVLSYASSREFLESPCRRLSLALTGLLAIAWCHAHFVEPSLVPGLPLAAVVAVLALVHAWIERRVVVAGVAVLFANLLVGIALFERMPYLRQFVSAEVFILLVQWSATYFFAARPDLRISQAFGKAVYGCTSVLLGLTFGLIVLPWHTFELMTGRVSFVEMVYAPSLLTLVWAFDAARRLRSKLFAHLALAGLYVVIGSLVSCAAGPAYDEILATWTVVTAVLVLVDRMLQPRRVQFAAWCDSADLVIPIMTIGIWALSWTVMSPWMMVVGLASPLVLAGYRASRSSPYGVLLPAAMLNWRALWCIVGLACPEVRHCLQLAAVPVREFALPVAFAAALSLAAWTVAAAVRRLDDDRSAVAEFFARQRAALAGTIALLMLSSLALGSLDFVGVSLAAATFAVVAGLELFSAYRHRDERRVWSAQAVVGLAVAYLARFGVVQFGHGWSMYVVLVLAVVMWIAARVIERIDSSSVFIRPFRTTAMLLPGATVGLALYRHVYYYELLGRPAAWLGWNSLALLSAAAFYFWRSLETRRKGLAVGAAAVLNVAVALLWRELRFSDPQFYLIPVGITVLALVELLEREIPVDYRNPLRYFGSLVILVSPTFHIVDGSWLHLFSLMVAAVVVLLVGIGLRIRAMTYSGTAFLLADLAAMVIRGSIDNPGLLWIAGLGLGAAMLALGAACELRREQVQQRVRAVAAALDAWK